MKKLNALIAGLMIAGSVSAQLTAPMTPVGWGIISTTDDWSDVDNAEPKANVEIGLKASFVYDAGTFDFDATWESIYGSANVIANNTKRPEGVTTDPENLETSWKAFYNNDALFVLIKVDDPNTQVSAASFEVMYQTATADRFEPDFTAAGTDIVKINNSYCRYMPLGGYKVKFDNESVSEIAGNAGNGTWGNGTFDPAAQSNYDFDDVSTKYLLVLPFESALAYKADPYSADAPVAFDPLVKSKISFDVKSNLTVGDGAYEYFWNSTDNNGYGAIFYSGYLTFNPTLSVKDVIKSNLISKIGKDEISFTKAVNANIYNVMGQQVKSVKNADRVSISGLANGVYIVKAGNSSFKFVKK